MEVQATENTQPKLQNGINLENIKWVLQKVREVVGEEWATDSPAILTSYHRDFTHVLGGLPNMVAMPETTEHVRSIMQLAWEHEIPVVTFTTGFNVAGLTLCKRGGIILDLKRMDKILNIDYEAMTVTIQPHARNAAMNAEMPNHKIYDDIGLRVANPITMGSASLFSNMISGGMSYIALSAGAHEDNIVSQTIVMANGDVIKTRSALNPKTGNVAGCMGPGPDISGVFFASSGMFGVVTEMTICLFPEFQHERLCILHHEDARNHDIEPVINLYYDLTRANFIRDIYKTSSTELAMSISEEVEAMEAMIPVHVVLVSITGNSEEELDIKEEELKKITEKHGFVPMNENLLSLMTEATGLTLEAMSESMKKFYYFGRVMRWKGAFYFTGCCVTMDQVPMLQKNMARLRERYIRPADPNYFGELLPADCALQGPLQLGRNIWFEMDLWYDPGHPEQVKRAQVYMERLAEMMVREKSPQIRDFANGFRYQTPHLGTYVDLLVRAKKAFDPANIMNRDVMNIPGFSEID